MTKEIDFFVSGRILSFVHFKSDGRAIARMVPRNGKSRRPAPGPVQGGVNEKKLD
jgi:hypothetical protein